MDIANGIVQNVIELSIKIKSNIYVIFILSIYYITNFNGRKIKMAQKFFCDICGNEVVEANLFNNKQGDICIACLDAANKGKEEAKQNTLNYCPNCGVFVGKQGFCSEDCFKEFYKKHYDKEKHQKGEKYDSWLSRLWNSTIFPDMIKERKDQKRIKRQLTSEAKKEAMKELKPELIKHYKQVEKDKLTGKNKGDFLNKLAKGFEGVGANMDSKLGLNSQMQGHGGARFGSQDVTNEKLSAMIGKPKSIQGQQQTQPSNFSGMGSGGVSNEKIMNAFGRGQSENKISNKETADEKLKRMLGRG